MRVEELFQLWLFQEHDLRMTFFYKIYNFTLVQLAQTLLSKKNQKNPDLKLRLSWTKKLEIPLQKNLQKIAPVRLHLSQKKETWLHISFIFWVTFVMPFFFCRTQTVKLPARRMAADLHCRMKWTWIWTRTWTWSRPITSLRRSPTSLAARALCRPPCTCKRGRPLGEPLLWLFFFLTLIFLTLLTNILFFMLHSLTDEDKSTV